MACYHPETVIITEFRNFVDETTGEFWPVKRQVKYVAKGKIIEKSHKELLKSRLQENQKLIEIPCGKCDGCKQNEKQIWATRCFLESLEYKYNYMITLTYNDENAPIGEKGRMTLKKKDFQDFMKRLRTQWERKHNHKKEKDEDGNITNYGIRYKMCSEYGSEEKTMRPHYHFVGFNLPIYDLEKFFISETDGQVYKSKELEEVWGKGYVTVVECNWNTCAYVSGYVMKKATSTEEKLDYKAYGIEPEFTLGSTNPGIGYKYFKDNYEKIYKQDGVYIKKKSKKENWRYISELQKPPRYFDKLMEKINPELMEKIKKQREEKAEDAEKMLFQKTNLSKEEYLRNRERKHKEALKLIKRRKMVSYSNVI